MPCLENPPCAAAKPFSRRFQCVVVLCALAAAAFLTGCTGAYLGALESLGFPKRDILSSRVEDARESQQDAKEQLTSALDQFREVVAIRGGDIEEKYYQLKGELEASDAAAREVRERIEAIERVAEALFDEWEEELEQYSNAELRRRSAAKLSHTKSRYRELMRAMHRAESKIQPVLEPLRDQVLFLKHNLNARAIASLDVELSGLERRVSVLVDELEHAIAEADRFLRTLKE